MSEIAAGDILAKPRLRDILAQTNWEKSTNQNVETKIKISGQQNLSERYSIPFTT